MATLKFSNTSYPDIRNGIVTSGLVLNLDAGQTTSYPGTGTTWTDLSGSGNNGTLVGGPTYSSANQGSILFDGSNDYASVPAINLTSAGTVSVWFYKTGAGTPDAAGVVDLIANLNTTGTNGWSFAISNTSNKVVFYIANNGGFGVEDFAKPTISNNTWYNAVATYNGSSKIIYINGVQDSTFASSVNGNATATWGVASRSGGTRHFQGSIPQASIYNRALTAAEVAQNFNCLRMRYGV